MAENVYLKDKLIQKKPFTFTDENGEKQTLYECYSMTEEPFDENGYFVKHFYTKANIIEKYNIGDTLSVKFSHKWKKFYVSE